MGKFPNSFANYVLGNYPILPANYILHKVKIFLERNLSLF